jgi:hypothetical protein
LERGSLPQGERRIKERISPHPDPLPDERLREVYDFVRFLSIESVEDFSLMKGVEILSQESLREFLESEPDIYSYDDIKERNG